MLHISPTSILVRGQDIQRCALTMFLALIARHMIRATVDDYLPKALEVQQERTARIGRGEQQLWAISGMQGFLRTQYEPSQPDELRVQTVEGVPNAYNRLLSDVTEPTEQSVASEVR